ncbi:hypothetical protein [Arenibaculum pallidiluteum]|uniref:hypothetical protein n=1 Tax=Arenibaculum pallidiluteum TaxID=2812559 RepID=UPI001A960534|nr:hypothetical protein [Arenibaculum pallidiluteum]
MALIKIPLLPGIFKDDTPLSAEGRFVDADKVRFVQGRPQTIGGWESVTTDTVDGVCRGIHTWADTAGERQIGLGTHSHLYAYQGGAVYDITPAGLAAGLVDGLGGAGFGTGAYGSGTYGAASTGDVFPRTWSLDNWGEYLIANPRGGKIYEWRLDGGAAAAGIAGAPDRANAVFVTPERQLVVVGCTNLDGAFDPMCVRASDIEDNTEWTPSATTSAVQRVLSGGSRLVRGLASRGINLIWSDTHLFGMRYVGDPPLVFSFATLGGNCGLLGPNAVTLAGGSAYWLAPNGQFFVWAGGEPQAIPCTLRRDVMDNLAAAQGDKVFAASVTQYGEIWWFYPDARDGNEVSRYVAYNHLEGHWTCGSFDRTAFTDAKAFDYPIGVSAGGRIYFHERGFSADGGAFSWRFESAPIDIGDGSSLMAVRSVIPDTEDQQGTFSLSLSGRAYPPSGARMAGPYTVGPATGKVDTRIAARQVALAFAGSAAPCFLRLGALRLDLVETGQRR